MDSYKTWFAFLCVEVIERCAVTLQKNCPGCQSGLLSPLLHYHTHFNLLDTLKKCMPLVVLEMDIQKLYNDFLLKFGLFSLPEDEFIRLGQSFVRFSTPDAIYYGNYITKENDQLLYSESHNPSYEPTPIKGKKQKKTLTSENGISGENLTS